MEHYFIKSNKIPDYIMNDFPIATINSDLNYKKCSKCCLEVVSISDHTSFAEYMYLNNIEVFDEYYNLKELDLTCNELIIKNIIE